MRKSIRHAENGKVFESGSHVGPLKAFRSIAIDKIDSRTPTKGGSPRYRGDENDHLSLTVGQTTIKQAIPRDSDYDPQ